MKLIDVNAADLIEQVRAVAAEQPEFVYDAAEGCHYFNEDGSPSCIVGQGLARLGVTLNGLGDGGALLFLNGASVSYLVRQHYMSANHAQRDWLDTVQAQQDDGQSWADAIDYADEVGGPR